MFFFTWKFSTQTRTRKENQGVEKRGMTWLLWVNKERFWIFAGGEKRLSASPNTEENKNIVLHHLQRAGKERSTVWGVSVCWGWWDSCELTLQPFPLPPPVICLWGWIPKKSLQSAPKCRIWVILAVGPWYFPAAWLFGWEYIYGLSHSVLKYWNSLLFVSAGICWRVP